MRLRTILRINPAVWLAPILALATIAYTTLLPQPSDPYRLTLTAMGTITVFLVAPVCAACAAWEGGRLQRAAWWELPHVRAPLTVALASSALILITGWFAVTVAVLFMLQKVGLIVPDLRLIAMVFIVIAAHTLLGFAIEIHVRPVVAVPATLLVDFAWMTLPRAIEPVWLRHLNSAWIGGFHVAVDVAPQALLGVVVVATGLAGSATLLLRRHLNAPRLALSLIPTGLALSVGAVLVLRLGYDPAVPRNPALLVCSSGHPRVCVWPEHRERLPEVEEIATSAATRWREAGVPVPAEFSERRSFTSTEHSFGISMESRQSDIINALAYSLLPPLPQCALEGKSEPYIAGTLVQAWLADVAGTPRTEFNTQFGPNVRPLIEAVRSMPLEQQRAWLNHNLEAAGNCNVAPQLGARP